jgi:VCBS repeat-containing protein
MDRRRPPVVFAAVALVSMLAAWLVVPTAAFADAYDDACGSPTTTIGASSTTAIDVTSTSVVLIAAGTFQGGINSWASGGVICVAAGATLQPPYMNNAAGALFNRGHVLMPGTAVQGGFSYDNFGQADFPNGFNTNGPATLTNHAGATWTMPNGFNTAAAFVNDGTATISNGFNQNGGLVQNGGTLTINGSTNLNGTVINTGSLDIAGNVNLNGGALLGNACILRIRNGFNNNSQVLNGGWVRFDPGTTWQNNGTYLQGPKGLTSGANMTNNDTVTGFGQYSFTGTTVTQGTFSGSSAVQPIVFDDTSPTGSQIFDTENGTIVNVVAGPVSVATRSQQPFGCGVVPPDTADVSAVQVGPAVVAPNGTVTYTIAVVSRGPIPATGVIVSEALPAALTGVTADGGGVVGGGMVTWSVGAMAVGTVRTFTVTGTAPASGTLVAVISSTSTSLDARPENNDGSSPNAVVTTVIDAAPPANQPPVVDDISVGGPPTTPLTGVVPMSDPDAGQVVTASLTTPPLHGTATVEADGSFDYDPTGAFTGVDTFVVTGCDNGSPSLCDTGTVTLTITPVPADDTATTTDGIPVNIDVAANDLGDTGQPAVVSGPTSGTTTVEADGTITYAPIPGFTGSDAFDYEVCSEVTPSVCAQATVTVDVLAAPNQPPVVGDGTAATTATVAATGTVTVSDPDAGQTVSMTVAIQGASGTTTIDDSGAFTYTPTGTFTGIDTFIVVGCDDGTPVLCDSGIVTVTVSPNAGDDAASTTDGIPVNIDVAANDVGDSGPPSVVSGPANGSATVEANGTVTYAPTPGFTGTDTFDYEICSSVSPSVCATATVTITVSATPNQPPVVGDATAATTATVAATGNVTVSDPDAGQTVSTTVSVGPTNGTATIDDSGAFTYTPTGTFTGTDTFTVQGCDDGTPSLCDTGTVTVTVSPVAVDDAATTTDGTPVEVDVQANDIGDALAPTIVTGPANGTAVIGSIIYTPNAGFVGADQVTYQVCSPNVGSLCSTAVLTITVTAATPTPTPTPTITPPPTDLSRRGPFADSSGLTSLLAASGILAFGILAAGAIAYRRRSRIR